jgi:hypothetical protein
VLKTTETGAEAVVRTADEGDVPSSALGIGYDPEVLDREAELEELAEAELRGADTTDARRPAAPRWWTKVLRSPSPSAAPS